ncbi:MAG: Crp/Fnr family transcriptional regulator [Bdellovibrionales bacterium]|nr:Crp/Fnr family transcriptional regulator [Bdellovibrionales bacterium]
MPIKGLLDQCFAESELKEFQRGDLIYRQGEHPHSLFLLEEGLVGLLRYSVKGQEHLLRLFQAGQVLGHRSIIADEEYHATARCIEPCKLRVIPRQRFEGCIGQHPEASQFMMRSLARDLRRAEVRSIVVTDSEVLARVAATLLYFKGLNPEHHWTRTEIANYCASRTPTVIKALGELEKRGLIEQKGREINILSQEGLCSLTDESEIASTL